MGLRLDDIGTPKLSWRDLKVIVTKIPPDKSALWLEKNPEDAQWGLANMLRADIADVQRLLLWSKTKDGEKGRNRPMPIERPGARPERLGKKPLPLDEMKTWLGWD